MILFVFAESRSMCYPNRSNQTNTLIAELLRQLDFPAIPGYNTNLSITSKHLPFDFGFNYKLIMSTETKLTICV